jgi:hypothetical protein
VSTDKGLVLIAVPLLFQVAFVALLADMQSRKPAVKKSRIFPDERFS